MIAWLESDRVTRPTTLDSGTVPEDPEALGRVTSTIEHGELFLHPAGDVKTWVRLRWSPEDEARTRFLAPGTYVVTGYRQLRTDDAGVPWIWSTSSVGYRRIEVRAGETAHVKVRDWIGLRTVAHFRKGKHCVGLVFLAEAKLGHTLYRDGRRIAVRWQCLDARGEVLGEGPMGYG